MGIGLVCVCVLLSIPLSSGGNSPLHAVWGEVTGPRVIALSLPQTSSVWYEAQAQSLLSGFLNFKGIK